MLKKISSCLLAILLLTNALGCALADIVAQPRLAPYAYTTDDHVCREYRNTVPVSLYMHTGEYQVISPLHWIQSAYLSYANISVRSSDPKVVSVNNRWSDKGNAEDNSLDAGLGSREYMGVSLYAGKKGSATVTVQFSTFLTAYAAQNYTDVRDSSSFTQTIQVTVDDAIEVSAHVSASDYENVHSLHQVMGNDKASDDRLIEELINTLTSLVFNVATEAVPMGGTVALVVRPFVSSLVQLWVNSLGPSYRYSVYDAIFILCTNIGGTVAQQQLSSLGKATLIDSFKAASYPLKLSYAIFLACQYVPDAWNLLKEIYELYKNRDMLYPVTEPSGLLLNVTVKNKSDVSVDNLTLTIDCSDCYSLRNGGDWGSEKRVQYSGADAIAPESEKTFQFNLYAKTLVKEPGTHTDGSRAHTSGEITVQAQSNVGDGQAVVDLPIYTSIASEEYAKFASFLDNPTYVGRLISRGINPSFWYWNQRVAYIACPVDLLICDRNGVELCAIHTDDDQVYQNKGLTAGAMGEAKYLMLSPENVGDYQIKIRAVSDGTMSVWTADYASSMSEYLFEDIQLKKGQLYDLKLDSQGGAALLLGDARMQVTQSVTRQSVAASLAQTDASSWALDRLATAYLYHLADRSMLESFQTPLTLEQFSAMLLNLYEKASSLPANGVRNEFLQSQGRTTASGPAMGGLASLGFLPAEYLSLALEEEAQTLPATVGLCAYALQNCLKALGICEAFAQDEASAIGVVRNRGILLQQGKTKDKPDAVMTRERGITAICDLWEYTSDYTSRSTFIVHSVDRLLGELTAYDLEPKVKAESKLYFRGSETLETMLRTFSLEMNQAVIDPNEIVKAVAYFTEQYVSGRFSSAAPVDVKRLEKQKKDLLMMECGAMAFQTLDGVGYAVIPVYYPNSKSLALEDAIYLYVVKSEKNFETETVKAHHMIIADQDIVHEYLKTVYPYTGAFKSQSNSAEIKCLKNWMEKQEK